MSKKLIAILVLLIFSLGMIAGCGGSSETGDKTGAGKEASGGSNAVTTVSLSLGGTTGMYYRTHAPMADYINSHSSKIRIVPTISSGSLENVSNLINGSSQLGCVYPDDAIDGYAKNDQLRFVGPTTKVLPLQFVVLANSGINTIEDLKGKVVSYGAPGAGYRKWAEMFMDFIGMSSEVTEVPLGAEEHGTALKDGDIAMFATAAFVPSGRVEEVALTNPVKILDLSEYIDDFIAKYPAFVECEIPAGGYKGHDVTAKSFGQPTVLLTTAKVPDEVITEYMTWAYTPEAQAAALTGQPQGPDHDSTTPLANMVIPIHPAAQAFWESKGYTVNK